MIGKKGFSERTQLDHVTFHFTGKYHGQAGGLETGGSSDFDSGEFVSKIFRNISIKKNIFAAAATILILYELSRKCAYKPVLDKLDRYSVYV